MATKPTQDPKWVTTDDPNEIIEPSPALKTNGVQSGGIWGREHLNWMFNSLSKWIDWVRSSAMDKDNNLSDVADKPSAFTNIKQNATTTTTGVVEQATQTETLNGTANKFPDAAAIKTERDKLLVKTSNLNDVVDKPTAFNNIKQNATTTSTGVVEKATDTETESGTSGKFPDAASISSKFLKKSDNLSSVASASTSFNNIKQLATTTSTGVVEEATTTEMRSGTNGKFPDAATIQTVLGTLSAATTGYYKDKNSGFILQWGKTGNISLGGTATDTFATPFPNACLGAVCSLNTSIADNVSHVRSISSTQIQIFVSNTGGGGGDVAPAFWFAVGY